MASKFTAWTVTRFFPDGNASIMGIMIDIWTELCRIRDRDFRNWNRMAESLGVSPSLFTRWEAHINGISGKQARSPKLETIAPILDVLGIKIAVDGSVRSTRDGKGSGVDVDRELAVVSADLYRILRGHGIQNDVINEVQDAVLKISKQQGASQDRPAVGM